MITTKMKITIHKKLNLKSATQFMVLVTCSLNVCVHICCVK